MRLIAIATVWFVSVQAVAGQTTTTALPDSLRLQNSIAQAFAVYQQVTGPQSHLYNGWEYVEYDAHIEGHQFFETDYTEEGSVQYDGVGYTQVPMLYDLVKDQLVIEHDNNADRIILISEKVKEFAFLGHTYVRLVADSSRSTPIRSGFYDQLYNGRVKVFAKRVKTIHEEIVQNVLNRSFIQKDTYYVWKEGRYHAVKSKRSVMNLFGDHKKELGRHLREQKIRFRQSREAALVSLAIRYDQLRK